MWSPKFPMPPWRLKHVKSCGIHWVRRHKKIAFKALLLALATARATLSQVDLAASGLVHPILTESHTLSSIEHKNGLIAPIKEGRCI